MLTWLLMIVNGLPPKNLKAITVDLHSDHEIDQSDSFVNVHVIMTSNKTSGAHILIYKETFKLNDRTRRFNL